MSTRCSAIRISTFAGPFHPRSFSSCPHWRAPAAIWFSNCCRRNSHSLAARHCESHDRDTGQPTSARRSRTAASVWPWTQNHSSSCSICSANLDSFRIPFSRFTFHPSRSTFHLPRFTFHVSPSTFPVPRSPFRFHVSRLDSTFHVSHFTLPHPMCPLVRQRPGPFVGQFVCDRCRISLQLDVPERVMNVAIAWPLGPGMEMDAGQERGFRHGQAIASMQHRQNGTFQFCLHVSGNWVLWIFICYSANCVGSDLRFTHLSCRSS